jgi:hypothetical protein
LLLFRKTKEDPPRSGKAHSSFFEKKKQKNFYSFAASTELRGREQGGAWGR